MTIKGIMTSNKGHVTKIEKVSFCVSGIQAYHVTHQFWWNSVQKWLIWLRNKPPQTFAFFGDI